MGLLLIAFGMSNCNPIFSGELDVLKSIPYVSIFPGKIDSFPPKPKKRKVTGNIQPGHYMAEFKYVSKFEMQLIVNKDVVVLRIPKGKSLPDYSGRFNLTGSEIKQSWGVAGDLKTHIDRDGPYFDEERCSVEEVERVCKRKKNEDGERERVCEDVVTTYYGYQEVEYEHVTTTKNLELDIVNKQKDILGEFHGSTSDTEKNYIYVGRCIVY